MLKRLPIFLALLLIVSSPLRAIWLNGYFHGKRGDLIVDTQEKNTASKSRGTAYASG
jgi:hypothetical protein